jgi:hypothetical protein
MATYTIAQLETLLLEHLRRTVTDDAAFTTSMDAAINRCRREIWRRCGGPTESPSSQSVVAGTADYLVGVDAISAVSVIDSAGSLPRFLRYIEFSDVIDADPNYPGDGTAGTRARPSYYMIVPGTLVTATPGVTVRLYPIPDTSVTNGITFYSDGPTTDLASSNVSPLPPIFDETACWMAAAEFFSGKLADEDEGGTMLQRCESQTANGVAECHRFIRDAAGGDWNITLSAGDNYGTHSRDMVSGGTYLQRGY